MNVKCGTIINEIKMLETFYYLGLDFLAFGGAVDDLDDDKSNDADDDNANPEFDEGDDEIMMIKFMKLLSSQSIFFALALYALVLNKPLQKF